MPYISLSAYSTAQSDAFAFTGNQAALAQIRTAGAGVFTERRFLLTQNSVYGCAVVFPSKLGNFGVQVNYSGFKDFNESKAGFAYARALGHKFDIGIQFNYLSNNITGYGKSPAVNVELGTIMHLSENFNAGIYVCNPAGTGEPGSQKPAPVYKLGFGYDASENFYVSIENIKEANRDINVICGFQYQFINQFFLRAGLISETGSGFAAIGVGWQNLRLDLSGTYHPQLGLSPGLILIFNLKDKP